MSLDKMLKDMVRDEVQRSTAPMLAAVSNLQAQSAVIARLTTALSASSPKPAQSSSGSALSAKSWPGRKSSTNNASRKASETTRLCAVSGCRRSSRSKGYCPAHYQKYRMLIQTERLPSDWVENALPGSVKNLVLPRGRAGAKALAETKS